MSASLDVLVVGIIMVSHVTALRRFWRRLARRIIPSVADFACASLVLYYDTGLLLELLGVHQRLYFAPLLEADSSTLAWALALLVVAPWAFRAGEWLFRGQTRPRAFDELPQLRSSRRWLFYALVTLAVAPLAYLGFSWLTSGEAIWTLRARVAAAFGPLTVVLYIPMYVLGFYVRQGDSRTYGGRLYSLLLVGASIIATAAYGQRTTVLLPILIVVLFGGRLTRRRVITSALGGVLVASILLPLYKWQFSGEELGADKLVTMTVGGDVARSGVLRKAIELSDNVGTRVMPYPLAGYLYGALLFVPRQVIPFKGESTARTFTSYVEGTRVEETNWGFGVGAIEEAAVNGGLIMTVPVLLLLGCVMGLLQRASIWVPSLIVPTRLAALWVCGYHLPALMLLFGGMVVVALVLDRLFVVRAVPGRRAYGADTVAGWTSLKAQPSTW